MIFFTDEEKAWIEPFLDTVYAHLSLGKRDTKALLLDHQKVIRYLLDQGASQDVCIKRLSPHQLGDFYQKPCNHWFALDVAAKVYPLRLHLAQMNVFRVSCELKEVVVPEVLQMALTYTIKRFPTFATTLKHGFFWHYLDGINVRFPIREENQMPCKPIGIAKSMAPSFRVLYFHKRISVEFFHALTDGTGAGMFLSTLVHTYLQLLGADIPLHDGIVDINESPPMSEMTDQFPLCDKGTKGSTFADQPALQISGGLSIRQPCEVYHFDMPTDRLLHTARSHGVTITTLMLSYLFLACKASVRPTHQKRKLQIQMPINMRKIYPSNTLRNFSMFAPIRLDPSEVTDLEGILPLVASQVKQGVCKEAVDQGVRSACDLVSGLKFVPLMIKRPIAHLLTQYLGDRLFTTTLSNVGIVALSPQTLLYVEKVFYTIGASMASRAMCCMCTTGNHTVLTITKSTVNPTFENALYDILQKDNLVHHVEGSKVHEK